MTKFSKILATVGVIAGVVLIGIALGWWGSRRTGTPPEPPLATPVDLTPVDTNRSFPGKGHPRTQPSHPALIGAQSNEAPAQATVTATNLITDWEDKVDQILVANSEESDKVKQMLEMFPRLPEQGQVEVAQHLSNLTPDDNYAPLGGFLTNSSLPEAVLDVLISDVLNRPNSVKLPLLLDVAQDPQHPKASEAKDVLELFLEEDYGKDWAKWQAKMEGWLKENPD